MKTQWQHRRYLVILVVAIIFLIVLLYYGSAAVAYLRMYAKARSSAQASIVHKNQNGTDSLANSRLITKFSGKVSCDDCSIGFCSRDEPLPDISAFSAASVDIQAFFNLTFQCEGEITDWKFVDQNPAPGRAFYFDVLKYDQTKDEGTWVGYNRIQTTGESGWITHQVPKKERIKVEPGFFVGIHYDDVAIDPVIPFADPADNPAGFPISGGFAILLDHKELSSVAKVGQVAEVAMSKIFKHLLIAVNSNNWRMPALAAIVEKKYKKE